MSAQHTPGPWQVNYEDSTQVCDADGKNRGCARIAHCRAAPGYTVAERRANARLIAAAPDMLAALVMLTGKYGITFQDAALRSFAVDAIRKATGSAT